MNKNLTNQREALKSQISVARNAMRSALDEGNTEAYEKAEREFKTLNADLADLNESINFERSNVKPVDENESLRTFLREADPRKTYTLSRSSMSTSDTNGTVQGLSLVEVIKNDRPDADFFAATGAPITYGVNGNKIQWAKAGGVEAEFKNELAQTAEKTVDLNKYNPVQQRLTVRVRISNQALENSSFDIRSYIINAVRDSIKQKINWAATSTTKATSVFYGPFANATETGTYGGSNYVEGKQAGTYTSFSKDTAAEMVAKLASRNFDLKNTVFVMGAEDFWTLKVTPKDSGSGIMLIGDDNKLLGIPVFVSNAINKATQKGAVNGHNIGLTDGKYLPTMQHGDFRLSIDGSSAYAADTDELIVTVNSDWSMTNVMPDATVLYAKTSAGA